MVEHGFLAAHHEMTTLSGGRKRRLDVAVALDPMGMARIRQAGVGVGSRWQRLRSGNIVRFWY
jgi:hypothetical protein